MSINASASAQMKVRVARAKAMGKIVPAEKAFSLLPPEGTWHTDSDGNITVKASENHEV
jgi:hypothetical protein